MFPGSKTLWENPIKRKYVKYPGKHSKAKMKGSNIWKLLPPKEVCVNVQEKADKATQMCLVFRAIISLFRRKITHLYVNVLAVAKVCNESCHESCGSLWSWQEENKTISWKKKKKVCPLILEDTFLLKGNSNFSLPKNSYWMLVISTVAIFTLNWLSGCTV